MCLEEAAGVVAMLAMDVHVLRRFLPKLTRPESVTAQGDWADPDSPTWQTG